MKYPNLFKFSKNLNKIFDLVSNFLAKLYDTVFPHIPTCVYCKKPLIEGDVCDYCAKKLESIKSDTKNTQEFFCYYYTDIVKSLMHAYKYYDQEYLCDYIAREGSKVLQSNGVNADIITFVPLHPARLFKRGYNQARLIAKKMSEFCSIEFMPTLKRIKNTSQQATLNQKQREQNMKNAFKIKNSVDIAQKSVIIVDDIKTTGATLMQCKKQILQAGAKQVILFTFSKTQ